MFEVDDKVYIISKTYPGFERNIKIGGNVNYGDMAWLSHKYPDRIGIVTGFIEYGYTIKGSGTFGRGNYFREEDLQKLGRNISEMLR